MSFSRYAAFLVLGPLMIIVGGLLTALGLLLAHSGEYAAPAVFVGFAILLTGFVLMFLVRSGQR